MAPGTSSLYDTAGLCGGKTSGLFGTVSSGTHVKFNVSSISTALFAYKKLQVQPVFIYIEAPHQPFPRLTATVKIRKLCLIFKQKNNPQLILRYFFLSLF